MPYTGRPVKSASTSSAACWAIPQLLPSLHTFRELEAPHGAGELHMW